MPSPETDAQAEALVAAFCRWHIAPSIDVTLTLDGSGTSMLVLPSLHVTAVGSVTVEGVALEAGSYRWSEAGLLVRVAGRFPCKPRSVEVAFTHGYDTMPADVQAVIDAVAARVLSTPATGVTQQAAGPFSLRLAAGYDGGLGLLSSEQAILARYRRPPRF